jgi:hypothetical protein
MSDNRVGGEDYDRVWPERARGNRCGDHGAFTRLSQQHGNRLG